MAAKQATQTKINTHFVIFFIALSLVLASFLTFFQFQKSQLTQVAIQDHLLDVEVVSTPQRITLGLSKRDQIGSDGMLFVFGSKMNVPFWMKDMRFALDFVWIANGKIVGMTENVPPPATQTENEDQNLRLYYPPQPVDMVLEINAGDVQQWHLHVGDLVSIK